MIPGLTDRSPFVSLFYATVCCLVGLLMANLVVFLTLEPLFGIGIERLYLVITSPTDYPEARNAVMYSQFLSAIGAFILGPLAFFTLFSTEKFELLTPYPLMMLPLVLGGVAMFTVMPFLSIIIQWNAAIDFPAFMDSFERYAQAQETQMEELTIYLTSFENTGQFLFGLLAMAVVPAIGEELLFRGILQTQLYRWVRNPHVAIFLAAFVFSFIHVQFYGFVPRLVLGMLLGYLFWFSGNIWVAILGHFLNNAYAICAMYYMKGEEPELLSPADGEINVWVAAVSFLLTLGLLYQLWKWHSHRTLTVNE